MNGHQTIREDPMTHRPVPRQSFCWTVAIAERVGACFRRSVGSSLPLFLLLLLTHSTGLHADTADRQALLNQIDDACPLAWEALDAGYIGDDDAIVDPWQGNPVDRGAFIAYLGTELAAENLSTAELEAMAADPMAVIAECSVQKLRLLRAMAIQAAEVAVVGVVGFDGDSDELAYPDGSTQSLAAPSCEEIEAAYPSSESGEYWIDPDGGDTANAQSMHCQFGPPDGSMAAYAAASCKSILDNYPDAQNGVYWLDVNAGETTDAFPAYCDMTAAGGGWTLIVAQFEADQLANWNEGIQQDYDPTLASGTSFTLASHEIPTHAETAFGKSLDPVFVDYVDFVYSTSEIEVTLLGGKNTPHTYQLHRANSYGYNYGNPEESINTSSIVHGRLTFDQTGGRHFSWCYSPAYTQRSRGYAMNGSRGVSYDAYAWTIWVR